MVVLVDGLVLLSLLAAAAPAEPVVELRWDAPPGCPDRSKIDADLARFLAHGAQRDDVPVVIDARVTRAGEKFVLALSVRASAGAIEKTMRADDCKVLASAVALVVAVLLDPTAVVETVERERVATVPVEPVAEPPKPEPRTQPQPKPRKKPKPNLAVQGLIRPLVAGSFGPLPRFGVAAGGIVGVRIGRARIEAHAPRWRTLEVPVCAGGEIGRVRGRGFGLSVSRSARATWAAFTAGATLLWVPLRWIAVGGGVDAVVALTRPSFVIDDIGRVHRPRPAGVRIHAGLELRFP
jgi:hypothetical protein